MANEVTHALENNNKEFTKRNKKKILRIEDMDLEDYKTDIIILDLNCSCTLHRRHSTPKMARTVEEIYEEIVKEPEIIQEYSKTLTYEDTNNDVLKPTKIAETTNASNEKTELTKIKFQCNECDARYLRRPDLVNHYRESHDLSNIKCKFCNKLFTKRTNLKRHQNYICKNNEARLKNNGRLKYGMIAHPFICDHCKKSYNHKRDLIYHLQTHFGIQSKFKCNLCKKDFLKKFYLTLHMNSVHMKMKIHKCKLCKIKFARKCTLIRHERAQHQEEIK